MIRFAGRQGRVVEEAGGEVDPAAGPPSRTLASLALGVAAFHADGESTVLLAPVEYEQLTVLTVAGSQAGDLTEVRL